MIRAGITALVVGAVLVGYSLTVGAFAPVPTLPVDTQLLRFVIFLGGMLSVGAGIALCGQWLTERSDRRSIGE